MNDQIRLYLARLHQVCQERSEMSLDTFKTYMYENHKECIEREKTLHPQEAKITSWPENLNEKIKLYLQQNNINGLYSHQRQAFEALQEDKNTVIVAGTASGKTLSFLLPIYAEL